MTTVHLLPPSLHEKFEVREWRNATAVLKEACPQEWQDVLDVLDGFQLLKNEIMSPGGQKSPISRRIDSQFYSREWREKSFETAIKVDDQIIPSPTHKIDCFRGRVGLEVEWNNKDPFFDRDLNNFRLLFDLRTIDVGIIITRSDELQNLFNELGRGKSYGQSTTHMSKLLSKIEGGGGGGCPILVFGIQKKSYVEI